jgi:nitrogen regulatory protein P-II 1
MTSASSTVCAACNAAVPADMYRRHRIKQFERKAETAVKLITAIVRPEKVDELISALIDVGIRGLTVTDVRGFGNQYGRLADAMRVAIPASQRMAALLPKVRLDLVVLDDDAETIVDAIAKHARSETIGDGKIWVTTVDSALRVRTGERDRAAV